MKACILSCWALLLCLPLCHAQCDLTVPDAQLLTALSQAGLIPETDPSKFTLQDTTNLCFVRSTSDPTRYDQVRVSILYTYDTATDQSAQATFTVCLFGTFRFSGADVGAVTQDTHITQDMTREDCQDCLDSSVFARPSYCRLDDPCDASPCANGGVCSRTGLTDFDCACNGNWGGATCGVCGLVCENGGAINSGTCTCDCADGFSGATCGTCSRVCSNGGTLNSGSCTCACRNAFSGSNCEFCNLACENGGTVNTGDCTCNCVGSFSGATCGVCSLTCENGGAVNSGTCTCDCADGFSGATCGTCSRVCSNGGILNTGSCTCACRNAFSGSNCEFCNLACENGGTVNTGDCTCNCVGSFSGATCGDCSLICENGGAVNTGTCTCDCADGFSGATCGTCSRACINGGTLNPGSCTCACRNAFSGSNCEVCDLACDNGGTVNTGDCTCNCVGSFSGATCGVCSLTCENEGIFKAGTCTCDCADGFGGANCGICTRVCSNGGTLNPGSCTCACRDGFSGANCEVCNLACENGGTVNKGACTCNCVGGFSGATCGVCSVTCASTGTFVPATCTCACDDGYSGTTCNTCSRICYNGGTLNRGSCTCTCRNGFFGANCEGVNPGALRLQDGDNKYQGRVEIFLAGEWWTICDDTWDIVDADVVCRQLGYGYAIAAPQRNFFPFSIGPIWKVNANCTGSESRITDCHAPSTQPEIDCFHYEDVGVVCAGKPLTNGALRLVGGGHSISTGFLEMYFNSQWGTICSEGWDTVDTMVACSQLGFSDVSSVTFAASDNLASSQPIHSSNVRCSGAENSIFVCNQNPLGTNNCSHASDITVMCTSAQGAVKFTVSALLLTVLTMLLVK